MKKWLLIAALVASACGPERSELWDQPMSIVGPIETSEGVAYINQTTNEALFLKPKKDERAELDIVRKGILSQPGITSVTANGERLLVVDNDEEILQIINVSDPSDVSEVELAADFDRITVDPFNEFVVLSFSGASAENVVARNLNEVGVIDLRSEEPTAIFTTLSTRADSFSFAPPFSLDGEPQRIMAVLARDELTIFDLLASGEDEDEDRLREVPLSISETEAGRVPLQTEFDISSESKLDVYLRTQSADISRITVRRATEGPRKLNLSTDQLTVPAPSAMELVTLSNGATRLVTASQVAPTITVVDTISDLGTTFNLPMNTPAQTLIPYTTVVDRDGIEQEEIRILAYSTQSQLVAVIRPETVALEGDEPTLGRSVEAIRLEQFPTRISLATAAQDQAIVFHPSSGFSLLNLAKNNDVPIQGGSLREVLFDGAFAYVIYQTLPNLTVFRGDGHPTNFDLPKRGTSVHFDVETETLIVPHDISSGMFTVLDANDPQPETATVYENVFLENVFGLEFGDE